MLAIKPASGKPFLRTSPELEKEIGDKASKLLLQIDYWIRIGKNCIDDKWWTYQSTRDIQEKAFPGWALSTINRTIKRLETLGLIEIGNYNKAKYDKTRWFALKAEGLARLQSVILLEDEPRSEQDGTRSDQNGTGSTQNDTHSDQNSTTIPMIPTVNSSMNSTGITTSPTPAHDAADDEHSKPALLKTSDDPIPMPTVNVEAAVKAPSMSQPERETLPPPIPPVPPAPPFPDEDATDPDGCSEIEALKKFFTGCNDETLKAMVKRHGLGKIYATIKGVTSSKNVDNPPGLVRWQLDYANGGKWEVPKTLHPDVNSYITGEYADFIQH